MKKNEIKFYKFDESKPKVTFFEKKSNNFKPIFTNMISIAIIFTFISVCSGIYCTNKINEISASVYESKFKNEETMNHYAENLVSANVNFNEKYEVLINKANKISEETLELYNIVDVGNNTFSDVKLEEQTYKHYLELKKAVEKKGYFLNVRSGFRTFEDSKNIYTLYEKTYGQEYTKKYVAEPGTSEHNTGLAIDIVISNNKETSTNNYESDEYNYLKNIAYLYGFIIRYPKDKEEVTGYSYEPWHLRYVGKELAKYLTKNNITLEEYYETKE